MSGVGIARAGHPRATVDAAGSHWIVESSIGNNVAVNDAAFTDQQDGWVVGDSGALYYTHNGGLGWGRYNTGSPDNLVRIRFFDAQNGYALGGNTLLHTVDAGGHWQAILSDTLPLGLRDLTETNTSTLWAVASGSAYGSSEADSSKDGIYESTDAGKSWDKSANGDFAHISAPAPSDIWIAGSAGLYHTADAGNSWASVSADSNRGGSDVVGFASATLGFVAGTFSTPSGSDSELYIAQTADGGTTWDEVKSKGASPLYRHVQSISIVGPDILLAVTFDTGYGGTVASSDAGSHWTIQGIPDSAGELVAAGYRGIVPWELTHYGGFLHYGPLPSAATATPEPQPSVTQVDSPTDSPTAPAVVTFAAQPVAPTATATPDLLHLHGVSPSTVIQGSRATITVLGSNMDPDATISIGDSDITNAHQLSTGLQFSLPPEVSAGKFDVQVENPDGTIGVLHKALTVLPKLTIIAAADHPIVGLGFSLELAVHTLRGAGMRALVHTSNGHPAPHIVVSLRQQSPGEWYLTLSVGTHVPLGSYVAIFTAAAGSQRATISLRFQVSDMVGASL